MIKIVVVVYISLCFTLFPSLKGKEMLWDDFKSGDISNYLQVSSAVEMVKEKKGDFVLKMPIKKGRSLITTLKTPVKAGGHYKFSFKCKVNGPYTFEENPQIESLLIMSNKDRKEIGQVRGLANWRLSFQDGNGKNIRRGIYQFYTCMLFSKNKEYIEEFIVPNGTKTMTISFSNGNVESSIVITELKLKEIDNPKALNVNYDFSLGELNYSGWNLNLQFKCKIRENPKKSGDFQYDTTKGQAKMDPINVMPETRYNIHYRFSSKARSRVRVYFYGKNKKEKLLRPFIDVAGASRGKGVEGITTIVTPPKTTNISITINNGMYDYVKVTEFDKNEKNSKKYFKGE